MTLLLLRCLPSFPSLSPSPSPSPSIFYLFKPISSSRQRTPISAKIPARDHVVGFGKYKGKMLGTLPSKYLKWVSKNLRARDFEEWAKLADEVLQDPVYKDRLEWEFAEKILNGDNSRASRTENPVSHLLEISERFGWDNEDKAAWSRVDFALLGTSKGARIPRIGISDVLGSEKELGIVKIGTFGSRTGKEAGILQQGSKVTGIKDRGSLETGLGLRRQKKMGSLSADAGVVPIEEATSWKNSDAGLGSPRKMGSLGKNSMSAGSEELGSLERDSDLQKGGKVWFRNGESKSSEAKRMGFSEGRKVGFLSKGVRFYDVEEKDFEEEIAKGRREERRERQRLKRGMQLQRLRKEVGVKDDNPVDGGSGIQKKQSQKGSLNPFPGREALLRKANRPD